MDTKELAFALSHPGTAASIGILFSLIWTMDKRSHYLAFSLAYGCYAVAMTAQTLVIPQHLPANVMLSGVLYASAILLVYYGLMRMESLRPNWAVVGCLTLIFLFLRGYMVANGIGRIYQIIVIHGYFTLVLLQTCWQIRHLAFSARLDMLVFWVILLFTLFSPLRIVLALQRDPGVYGYDSSSFWITTQIIFNSFIVVLAFSLILLGVYRNIEKIRHRSFLDPLTRTYTRAGFQALIESGLVKKSPFSLALLDLDYFKCINDQYGHDAGDKVLQAVGASVKGSLRSTDIVTRYGGEEFLVLLPDTGIEAAVSVCEGIRRNIEQLDLSHVAEGLHTSVSIGVAECCASVDVEKAYKIADVLMYKAKLAGRNKICYLPRKIVEPITRDGELMEGATVVRGA